MISLSTNALISIMKYSLLYWISLHLKRQGKSEKEINYYGLTEPSEMESGKKKTQMKTDEE